MTYTIDKFLYSVCWLGNRKIVRVHCILGILAWYENIKLHTFSLQYSFTIFVPTSRDHDHMNIVIALNNFDETVTKKTRTQVHLMLRKTTFRIAMVSFCKKQKETSALLALRAGWDVEWADYGPGFSDSKNPFKQSYFVKKKL